MTWEENLFLRQMAQPRSSHSDLVAWFISPAVYQISVCLSNAAWAAYNMWLKYCQGWLWTYVSVFISSVQGLQEWPYLVQGGEGGRAVEYNPELPAC